jgi:hypothetical protein
MERVLDKRKEEALVVVTLSTATLIVCFSIIGRVPWPRWGEGHIATHPGAWTGAPSRARGHFSVYLLRDRPRSTSPRDP